MNLFHKKHEDGTAYSKEEMQAYRAEKAARKAEAVQREKTDWEKEEEARKLRNANYYSVLAQAKKEKKEEHAAPENAFLSCCHINKIYANRVQAVSDFNLDVKEGEFLVLVGPSGCGKSTTLRMIAGLEDITSGELFIDGRYVNKVEPKKRRVAMVFQSYALYPHMSVYENMAFGLEGTKEERMGEDGKMHEVRLSKSEIHDRVQKASEALQIVEYLDRKPTQLSGGQCQRVALGRAYVRNAKIFLLDEPLSNLDAKLRVQMRSELVRLHQNLSNTMVYVTHDQTEAMTMGSLIVVLKDGVIQQIATPKDLFLHPVNLFVAGFIGTPQMNFLTGKVKKSGDVYSVLLGETELKVPNERMAGFDDQNLDQDVIVGLRPKAIVIEGDPGFKEPSFSGKIDLVEGLGEDTLLYLRLAGTDAPIIASTTGLERFHKGQTVRFTFDVSNVYLFSKETERSLIQ